MTAHRRLAPIFAALLVSAALHAALIVGLDLPTAVTTTPPLPIAVVLGGYGDPATTTQGAPTTDPPTTKGDRPTTGAADTQPGSAPRAKAIVDVPAPARSAQPPASGENKTPDTGRPDYAELARAIAGAHTRRELDQSAFAGRSRSKRLTNASAKTAVEAAYLEMWHQKVERIGQVNYPPGGIEGELSVLAIVNQDGSLREARILEPSGHAALDQATLRIVRLAAPFSHFPTDLRKDYDRLEIVRQWRFERGGGPSR